MGSQLDMVRRLNDAGWLCTEQQDGYLKLRHAEKPGELIVAAPADPDPAGTQNYEGFFPPGAACSDSRP